MTTSARRMSDLRSSWVMAGVLVFMSPAGGAAVQVQDDTGRIVHLAQPARRIVSLAPHITENVFAAGAGALLVGVSAYSTYPAAARELPQVSSFNSIDVEAVLARQPDLVVAWASGNPREPVERLERLGLPVFRSEPRRLVDIVDNIEAIGALAGTTAHAHEVAETLRARIAELSQAFAGRAPLRVFYQLWDAPLMTVSGEHVISDVLRVCGAVNVFAPLPVVAPTVSVEAVIAAAPDVFVLSSETSRDQVWMQAWRRFDGLPALANERFVNASAEAMGRHTPRLLDEVEKLCQALDGVRRAMSGDASPAQLR